MLMMLLPMWRGPCWRSFRHPGWPHPPTYRCAWWSLVGPGWAWVKDGLPTERRCWMEWWIQKGTAVNYTLHLLPTCFLEGVASSWTRWRHDHTYFFHPKCSDFLARKRNYIDPTRRTHSTFGFHWHSQWDQNILDTSIACTAEELYSKLLNITLPRTQRTEKVGSAFIAA